MPAPHLDKSFGHGIHIFAMVITFGGWAPIWMMRWTMHKIDRTREAVFEAEQRVDALEAPHTGSVR